MALDSLVPGRILPGEAGVASFPLKYVTLAVQRNIGALERYDARPRVSGVISIIGPIKYHKQQHTNKKRSPPGR